MTAADAARAWALEVLRTARIAHRAAWQGVTLTDAPWLVADIELSRLADKTRELMREMP